MSTLTRSFIALAGVVMALWLVACAEGADALELSVVDDRGEPLAEVPIRAAGRLLARTDAQGKVRAAHARLQQVGALSAECPEAYRASSPRPLTHDPLPRSMQFVCRPRLRTLAVVAYAPRAVGALLRADAQPLGRVTADGTLHAVLRRPPGVSFQLRLEAEKVVTRTVEVRDTDEIVLFDGDRR